MAYIFAPTTSAPIETFFEKVARIVTAYVKHRKDQRTYGRILNMNNHRLADLGLTRDDVREAMSRTIFWG